MVVDLFVGVVADDPLADSNEGVKLGDSTLNRFLLLLILASQSPTTQADTRKGHSHLSLLFGFNFCGSWLKAQPLAIVSLDNFGGEDESWEVERMRMRKGRD